ncbi:ubiquitin carboxyl-terminal hydrolase CYLD isoform 3-T5 [Spinachia spinachia]
MTSSNLYFIVTRTPEYQRNVAGRICYISEAKHQSLTKRSSPTRLPVFYLDSSNLCDHEVEVSTLGELSPDEAELLQALPDDPQRLNWFKEREVLRAARGLTVGSAVTVLQGKEWLRGIVRFIGRTPNAPCSSPPAGRFFGIELQGEDRGKGDTDGICQKTLFPCAKDCGIFAPFSRVRPVVPSSLSPSSPKHSETDEVAPGDRVTYFFEDKCQHGMVLDVKEKDGEPCVRISTDTNDEVDVPLLSVAKGEVTPAPESMDTETTAVEKEDVNLSLSSMVEVSLGKVTSYGIIRWIGTPTGCPETMAGLELDEPNGVTDGIFQGMRLFHCAPKKGLFLKLRSCRPDPRFQSTSADCGEKMLETDTAGQNNTGGDSEQRMPVTVPPVSTEQVSHILIGRMKGIQGHYNSCYMDAALFSSLGGKVQESYCYQIFLDQNHHLVLPTVQQLLEHSFHNAGLKLAEVPPCFILQMPRFGKKFKMFDRIIPSLELDVTNLLSEGPQQCMLCGDLAQAECTECFKDPIFSQTGFKIFCQKCLSQVHGHPQRRSHQPVALDIPKGYLSHSMTHTLIRDKLELFAVLCIETSHYVSFIKHGPNSQDWIFFDSMADRQGEKDGFNIPEVHACPEVGTYLEMSPMDLANQVPRDMKGVAKRLFCDAYMYLYQSPNMCLYR